MRLLLDDQPADGNGPLKAEPPITAKIIANGKSERELLLERHNKKLSQVARKALDGKRTAEEQAAHALRENEVLKQSQQEQAANQKLSWMGFTS